MNELVAIDYLISAIERLTYKLAETNPGLDMSGIKADLDEAREAINEL